MIINVTLGLSMAENGVECESFTAISNGSKLFYVNN